MVDNILNVIKQRDFVIPSQIISNYQELKLDINELIFLIILINNRNNKLDVIKFAETAGTDKNNALESIYNLVSKDILTINTIREDKVIKEVYDLTPLYKKLSMIVINQKEEVDDSIYKLFENEFGRLLSKMEYEIITAWFSAGFSEEIIKEALKEAIYNNVTNLRYIDTILHNWKKNGINNKEDVKKSRTKFKKEKEEHIEIEEFDWLDED
jgi:DNA replication protein